MYTGKCTWDCLLWFWHYNEGWQPGLFLKKLDEHFPGMKQRYIQAFGSKYECMSPNNAHLTEVLREKCQKHGTRTEYGRQDCNRVSSLGMRR